MSKKLIITNVIICFVYIALLNYVKSQIIGPFINANVSVSSNKIAVFVNPLLKSGSLFVMNLDGSNCKKVLDDLIATSSNVSDDGKYMVVAHCKENEKVKMSLIKLDEPKLVYIPLFENEKKVFISPVWYPNQDAFILYNLTDKSIDSYSILSSKRILFFKNVSKYLSFIGKSFFWPSQKNVLVLVGSDKNRDSNTYSYSISPGDPNPHLFLNRSCDIRSISPDGKKVLIFEWESSQVKARYIYDTLSLKTTMLPPTVSNGICWSPDSKNICCLIANSENDANLQIFNLDSNKWQKLTDSKGMKYPYAWIQKNGIEQIIFNIDNKSIHSLDMKTKEIKTIFSVPIKQ